VETRGFIQNLASTNTQIEAAELSKNRRKGKQLVSNWSVATRYGSVHAIRNDKPISDALSAYGEWAQIEIEFLAQFLENAKTILDVGSHIGLHALAFASLSPNAKIHAFEPQPQLFKLLQKNVAGLGGSVVAHNTAIGDKASSAYLPLIPLDAATNAGASSISISPVENWVPTSVVPLDSMQFDSVEFLKLDIEGFEAQALVGAEQIIKRCRPAIYCEVNTVQNGNSIFEAIKPFQYDAYFVATAAFNPENFNQSSSNFFGVANESGLLLLPTGSRLPQAKRVTLLQLVRTIDEFAEVFLTVPRFGDDSAYHRDPKKLRALLMDAQAETILARQTVEKLEPRLEEISMLEAKCTLQDATLAEERENSQKLQSRLQTQLEKCASLELAVRDANLLCESHFETAREERQRRETLAGELESQFQSIQTLLVNNKELESTLHAAQGSERVLRGDNERLRELLKAERVKSASDHSSLVTVQINTARLAAELRAAQHSLSVRIEDLESSERECAELKSRIATLDVRLVEESTWRSNAEKALSEGNRKLDEYKAEKGLGAARIAALEAQLVSSEGTSSELRRRNDLANAQLKSQLSEHAMLKERISALETGLRSATALVNEMQLELEASRARTATEQRHATAAELRFEGLRQIVENERKRFTDLRSELTREQAAHRDTNSEVELHRKRNVAAMQTFESVMAPLAMNGLIASFFRKYAKGELAESIREIQRSNLFDEAWYRNQYPDVTSRWNPAAHYLCFGAFQGFNPGPNFDSRAYLEANPDVYASAMNPLLHYVRWGLRELRRTHITPSSNSANEMLEPSNKHAFWERPKAPKMSLFYEIADQRKQQSESRIAEVDVIIPVYRSYDDTLACIASVLATCRSNAHFELVVVDDCSPEPELSAALSELAQIGLITLHRNEVNLGFVGTVNRGMALHPDRDVVLLNSDTLVFGDWIDRLRRHVEMGHQIATVTPFTNNGTICSYPRFCQDNKEAFDRPLAELDQLFQQINSRESVAVPTGVGFCFYITRASLNDIGLFDEATFGKGYGEENDFCVRASDRGWKNLHALDIFVFHSGETSFAETAQSSKQRGLQALLRKHPDYEKVVESYVGRDPARAARIAVDVARAFGGPPKQLILCISHLSGGGIDRYLRDYAANRKLIGVDVLLFVPAKPGTLTGHFRMPGSMQLLQDQGPIDIVHDAEILRQILSRFNVTQIEVHSTVGWSHKVLPKISRLAQLCGVQFSAMLHDYVAVCPQITLINESGGYCGEEGIEQCNRCLSSLTDQPISVHPDLRGVARLNISGWRREYEKMLRAASEVIAPSVDTAMRYQSYFPGLAISTTPHVEDNSHLSKLTASPVRDNKVRIAVIGAIGPHKGSRVLLNCAKDALMRSLPIEFVVIGYTDIDQDLLQHSVAITGKYDEHEVGDLLASHGVSVAFLPSVWPETFCYTLSIALAAGLPTCVFDLGAQAERLANSETSLILPLGLMKHPEQINDQLVLFAEKLKRQTLEVQM
jgi:FkbM family methyltransferase